MRGSLAPSISRLTASIGAELLGVDLRDDLDDTIVGLLRTAVAEHHVVVLRHQFLDADQHAAVASAFGPILSSPVQIARGATRGHRRCRPSRTLQRDRRPDSRGTPM